MTIPAEGTDASGEVGRGGAPCPTGSRDRHWRRACRAALVVVAWSAGLATLAPPALAQTAPPSQDDELRRVLGLGNANGCFRLLGVANDSTAVEEALLAAGTSIGNELRAICGTSAVNSASSLGGALNSLQATKTVTQFKLVRRRIDRRLQTQRGGKPSPDLFFALQGPLSPGGATPGDVGPGIGLFAEIERETRDRVVTAYENGFDSDVDSLTAGVDFARGGAVIGGWVGRSDQEALLSGGGVLIGSPFGGAEDAALRRLLDDPDVRSQVCGAADQPGAFDQETRRYGVFGGIGRRGGAAFVDAAGTWSRRDHAYTRGVCAIENQGDPRFAANVVFTDANGNGIVDAGEVQPSAGRGVLFTDGFAQDGVLNAGDSVFDDVFAGTLAGATEIRETSYSIRAGGELGDRLTVGPRAVLTYSRVETDAYVETGTSSVANRVRSNDGVVVDRTLGGPIGLELAYDAQSRRSILLETGAEVAFRVDTPFGAVVPHASGFWRHEFDDDLHLVTASMAQDRRTAPARFTFATDGPDPDGVLFSGGVSALVGGRLAARLDVSRLAYDRLFTSRVVSVQARWRF